MPEVVYSTFLPGTQLIPGEFADGEINVNGASRARLLLYTIPTPPPPHGPPPPPTPSPPTSSQIAWSVSWGPTSAGPAFLQSDSGTFEDGSPAAIDTPVFGPTLLVSFESQASQDVTIAGTVYFINEVPPPILVR
jgi:hypothetical protein